MLVTGDSLSSSSSLASLASSSDAPSSLTAGGGGYFYKQIRGEVSRYCKARQTIFSDPVVQKQIEFCVSAYLSNHHCRDFTPALVPLCGPFIYVFQHESLALLAYTRMLDMMGTYVCAREQYLLALLVCPASWHSSKRSAKLKYTNYKSATMKKAQSKTHDCVCDANAKKAFMAVKI